MPKKRNNSNKEVKPVFHIFCEGETEECYLHGYINKFYSGNRRLKVIKIEHSNKNTAKELVEDAIKSQKNCPEGDVFWVVYDRESKQKYPDENHKIAYDRAKPKNISIAISNVCFEVWLLLHFQDTVRPYSSYQDLENNSELRQECKKRGLLDYEKGNKQLFEIFEEEELNDAKTRAKRMNQNTQRDADPNWTNPYQWNPYTNVHELLQAIDQFAAKSNL